MEFEFTPEQERFRQELREFLAAELPEDWLGMFGHPDHWKLTKALARKMAARGWLTLSWPKEYGGQEADIWTQVVFREEMMAHEEPRGPQYMGLNFIGPALMRFGTPEQKARFLPRIARGEVIWCQGFSEPNAGSDLASVECRAVRDGDRYVVTGRKIWISYADIADWCILLARTDPQAPKHRGLSMLLVDMKTPGITVRPIPNMFRQNPLWCELVFDEVPVPVENRLGEENEGWRVAVTALDLERTGPAVYALARRLIFELYRYACETDRNGRRLIEDSLTRRRLAEAIAEAEGTRLLNYRAVSLQARGESATNEASLARAASGLLERQLGEVGMAVLGPEGRIRYPSPYAVQNGAYEFHYRYSMRATVTAGSIQIQRNIIAQRGLGMPRT